MAQFVRYVCLSIIATGVAAAAWAQSLPPAAELRRLNDVLGTPATLMPLAPLAPVALPSATVVNSGPDVYAKRFGCTRGDPYLAQHADAARHRLVGTSVTLAGIQQVAQAMTEAYRQAGYPLAAVVIPPQQVADGIVVMK